MSNEWPRDRQIQCLFLELLMERWGCFILTVSGMGDSPGRWSRNKQSGGGVAGFPAGGKISCLVRGSSHAPPRVRSNSQCSGILWHIKFPALATYSNLGPGDPRLTGVASAGSALQGGVSEP